jgi:hypothetical protein
MSAALSYSAHKADPERPPVGADFVAKVLLHRNAIEGTRISGRQWSF